MKFSKTFCLMVLPGAVRENFMPYIYIIWFYHTYHIVYTDTLNFWVISTRTRTSGFEVISYSSISKRPIFCDPYESFSFFRRSLECLDLEQIKFKFPFLYRFKITPPFQQYFYTAFWFVNILMARHDFLSYLPLISATGTARHPVLRHPATNILTKKALPKNDDDAFRSNSKCRIYSVNSITSFSILWSEGKNPT